MKSRRQDFLLGLTSLALLALFMGTVLFVRPMTAPARRSITIEFRHEQGLAPIKAGSPVMLSGALEVGRVTSLKLRPADPASAGPHPPTLAIRVEAEVDRALALYENCEITTDQPPIGGGGVVTILNVGTPDRPPVTSQIIQGLPPQSFAAAVGGLSRRMLGQGGFVEKLERLVDASSEGSLAYKLLASLSDINAMTADLRVQLSPGEQQTLMGKIHRMADDLMATTEALRRQSSTEDGASLAARLHVAVDRLTAALSETTSLIEENRPAVRDTLTGMERLTRGLNEELLPDLKRELARDDPASLLGKLHLGLDKINVSLDKVVEITETGRRMLVLNRPALDRTIANLKQASDQLRVGIQELILTPWRILNAPASDEKARLEAFEAARRFAEAAVFLDDAAARLEAAVAAAPPGSARLEADQEVRDIQDALRSAFDRFRRAEEFLYQKMR